MEDPSSIAHYVGVVGLTSWCVVLPTATKNVQLHFAATISPAPSPPCQTSRLRKRAGDEHRHVPVGMSLDVSVCLRMCT